MTLKTINFIIFLATYNRPIPQNPNTPRKSYKISDTNSVDTKDIPLPNKNNKIINKNFIIYFEFALFTYSNFRNII